MFKEKMQNEHRWLCVFYRSIDSPFTTARRVSACFQVIMTSIAMNAIFYQYKTYDDIDIGEKILTAFWSALIVIPPNFLTIFILKRAYNWPMHSKMRHDFSSAPSTHFSSYPETESNSIEFGLSSSPPKSASPGGIPPLPILPLPPSALRGTGVDAYRGTRRDQNTIKAKIQYLLGGELGKGMTIIGYLLWFCLVSLSTLIILIYGLSFEAMTLDNWFLSSWLSVLQDALLNQPLFHLATILVTALIGTSLEIGTWAGTSRQ